MASKVWAGRADEAEIAAWKEIAVRLGVSFNRWARVALNDQAALDRALLAEREREAAE